nr:MAG: ORF1 [Torque teno midi virus]
MPFWWGRRKKWWWRGKRRPFYKRRRKRKTYKRRFYRNRYRRPARRRRRRRRTKVRRKLKKLTVKVWQPEKIVKCRIKGLELFCGGAEGKQFACFTANRDDWTPARNPGGGGFSVDKFTLQSLYHDFTYGKNVWSKSNVMLDLCRYQGCKFVFFRHQTTDFVVNYKLQPPFDLEKYTYTDCHPYSLMLHKHTRLIPSMVTKPHGKRKVIIKIKPPKLMQTKWYFQETFCKNTLVQLTIAAANFNYAYFSPTGTNQLMTFLTLNHYFYALANWGNTVSPYNPLGSMAKPKQVYTTPERSQLKVKSITISDNTYAESISYEQGWFQTNLLNSYGPTNMTTVPVGAARYNPNLDTGVGNSVWLSSVLNIKYDKPKTDPQLIISDRPLWQLLYGFFNFVQQVKHDKTFLRSYICVIESPAIYSTTHATHEYYIPLDKSFIEGKGQFNLPPTAYQKQHWFPTLEAQIETINAFVESGPYIPKYSNERLSNWELSGFYYFYFKWGGTQNPDEPVADPEHQGTYIIPDKLQQTLQIINPSKNKPETLFHCWDYRRGSLKRKAIDRIIQNTETDTDFQTDSETQKKKKKRYSRALQHLPEEAEEVQESLLGLCKESTFQETQDPQQLFNLIQQQQQHQRDIKQHLLLLISNLKKKQKILQLQTGLLE